MSGDNQSGTASMPASAFDQAAEWFTRLIEDSGSATKRRQYWSVPVARTMCLRFANASMLDGRRCILRPRHTVHAQRCPDCGPARNARPLGRPRRLPPASAHLRSRSPFSRWYPRHCARGRIDRNGACRGRPRSDDLPYRDRATFDHQPARRIYRRTQHRFADAGELLERPPRTGSPKEKPSSMSRKTRSGPFVVGKADDKVVRAVGTEFAVRMDGDAVRVTLVEGVVDVGRTVEGRFLGGGEEVTLERLVAGEQIVLAANRSGQQGCHRYANRHQLARRSARVRQ